MTDAFTSDGIVKMADRWTKEDKVKRTVRFPANQDGRKTHCSYGA